MRTRSIIGGLLLGLVAASTHAAGPDLSSWVPTWFKLRGVATGYAASETGIRRGTDRFTVYLKVWAYDAPGATLRLDAYSFEEDLGMWVGRTLDLRVVGGTAQDFVGWAVATDQLVIGLAARVTAKGSRATFKTLGGFSAETAAVAGDAGFAGGTRLAGKRIDAEAVPVPPGSVLH